MPGSAWFLLVFFLAELIVAAWIATYTICPCCWPFPTFNADCQIPPDPHCPSPPCVRKCCPKGQDLKRRNDASSDNGPRNPCIPSNSSILSMSIVPIWEDGHVRNTSELSDYSRYSVSSSWGLCPHGMYELEPARGESVVLLEDGYLMMLKTGRVIYWKDYCLDSFSGENATRVFHCFQPLNEGEMTEAEMAMFPAGMAISLPFLLLTGLVYLLLPELQNLHGKALLCHVFSMSVSFLVLIIIQRNVCNLSVEHKTLCKIAAFVVQFSFLATFFWLNVMCFDIWWVFSGLRPMQGSKKEREHKKFILYSLYAWGGPLVIFIITLCMELIPSIPDTFIKPHFGVNKCWFKDSRGTVLYFYLPIGVLVLLNIVMFITTAFRLQVHTRETKNVLKGKDSGKSDEADRQRFNLYLKLFIVMGINWVMELVSFAVGGPKSLWYVSDISNTLQGLLIFLIFVWKRRILRLLNQKICPNWNLVSATTTSKGSKVSSSRTSSSNLSKLVNSNPDSVAMQPIARKISTSDDSDVNN